MNPLTTTTRDCRSALFVRLTAILRAVHCDRAFVLLTVLAVIAALLVAVPGAGASTADDHRLEEAAIESTNPNRQFVPGEVIVRFEPGSPASGRAAARVEIQGTVKRDLLLPRAQVLKIPPGRTIQQVIERLEANPNVTYAEPNYIVQLAGIPNDPDFGKLWGLNNTGQTVNGTAGTAGADIDAPEAWDITQGSTEVLVGIIDTGIAFDHPDLAPNLWVNPGESGSGKETNGVDDDGNGLIDDWRGWDFVNNDNDPRDAVGHGTLVAGTIGARGNNATGVTGVSPQVSLVMAQACGFAGCPIAALVDAFMYVGDLGARIANVSISGATYAQAAYDAIAANPDTLYVVAAGNDTANNDTTPHYPCAYNLANILCVAATDSDDELASFSNYGAATVDLAAPGVDTYSTYSVPSEYTTRFSDDFENGGGNWLTGGTTSWALETCPGVGSTCVTDSPGGNYQNDTFSYLDTAATINVSTDLAACEVVTEMAISIEYEKDILFLQASQDGTSWETIDRWTGSTGGSYYSFDSAIPSGVGSPVYLSFVLLSDGSVTDDGSHIQSVEVRCVSATTPTYGYLSGTSFASPHVAGVAALLQAVDPSLTPSETKTILMDTVDPIGGLSGTSLSGGRLNAYSAVVAAVPNAAPVASDDPYDATEDIQLVVGAAAGVLFNDTDPEDDPLTVLAFDATSVEGGTVVVAADGSFTYDPLGDFYGVDTFDYTVSDGALTDTATVTITVAGVPDPPEAVDDAYAATRNTQLSKNAAAGVLFNDTDADGDGLTVSAFDATSAEGGTVVVAVDGSFTYDSPTDYTGTDTFDYTVSDGALTDTATVTITVSAPPPPGGGGGFFPPPVADPCPDTIPEVGFTDLAGVQADAVVAINCIAYYGITTGKTSTTYDPNGEVLRWQMALFLTRAATVLGIPVPASPADGGFTDLAGVQAEAVTAINQLKALGITTGKTATTFDPLGHVTRWQMAMFVQRLLVKAGVVLDEPPVAAGFVDLDFTQPDAVKAINQLAALGVVQGTTLTTYHPTGNVLRWQMALFLTRSLKAGGVTPE